MMLSKSGVSIRRLVSPRRPQNDHGEEAHINSDSSTKLVYQGRRKDLGIPRRRHSSKKRPPPPIIVSTEQSVHDIVNPLPPLPSETPRSSASSLCSWERYPEFNPSRPTDSRRSLLCSIASKEDRSEESLQLSSATSYGGDELAREPLTKDHARSPEFMRHSSGLSGPSFDSIEALSIQREDKAAFSKQHPPGQLPRQGYSDNIQQFIREADEAFKAVGSALAEIELTENLYKELPSLPTPHVSPVLTRPPPSRLHSLRPRVVASHISPLKRDTSACKVKRKKSKKSKSMKPHRKPTPAKQVAKSGPKWTLSDNVTELLSGKLFHKLEVDEMVTPRQVEEFRLHRMSQLRLQESTETLDTESTDTPIEPFHLEGLTSRIGSAGLKLNDDASADENPTASFFETAVRRDFSLEGQYEEQLISELPAISWSQTRTQDRPMLFKNASFPMPPSKHPQRPGVRKQRAALPSIPESVVAPAPDDELFLGGDFGHSSGSVADSNHVFLQSSPCSMTVPTFRHGPIRLTKSDFVPDVKFGAEEGLDWTAFQMAISGGAGDWFTDSDDTIRRIEAEDVEELINWWRSWNFDSAGGLITQEIEAPSPTSTTSGEYYSDVSYSEIEKDNPYSPHHQWQQLRRKAAAEGRELDLDISERIDEYDMTPSKEFSNRESYASLPQSPMLDLQVIRSPDNDDDVDFVPMGYNLGHDLGDFLKWEAEHAYAGDFCSDLGG
ncbi:hypothetical protein F4779DRAFT_496390 [Xylariaceae sp. FL0662B]|nr:hypothetical protein F4779DRAFT_496390 [Xylariaceae sp. FL0662B]